MSRKILMTKDYRMFTRSPENRPTNAKKHRKLLESMKQYGFLECYPIVVKRDPQGRLIVLDGQHRLSFAADLGLPVYYVEIKTDIDIALINNTQAVWVLKDYAEKFSVAGKKAYSEGLEFAHAHHLAIGTAFALLAGCVSFTNCARAFMDGDFKVKDREWADAVAGVYGPMIQMGPAMRNARFLEACMAICRVEEFEAKRLLSCANHCREKLVAYSTRDAYLDMLDKVYNFNRQRLVPLKHLAIVALRERNPARKAETKASVNGHAGEAAPKKTAKK